MTSAASAIPATNRRIEDWFVGLALLLLVVGFAPTFYLKPVFEAGKPLTLLVIAHGVTTTAWIVVFAFQYFAVNAGSRERHKTVGVIGAVLFGLVVALSLVTAVARVASASPQVSGPAPLIGLAYPFWVLFEVTLFGIGALASVRRPEWHRHFQFAGFFSFIAPATARALRFVVPAGPIVTYGSLLISILLYVGATRLKDVRSGRISRAAVVALGIQFLTLLLLFFSLDGASLWLQFASALTGYPQ
ncbi:hypothetical protein [Methylocystis heyeri]|uniref:Uncharacterized protein n=1 Tax=Methylocystis heyeri TaxID=391905 RepID=A0A6B8KHD2_9HYPH|nr:hypothetical protein [Methylocystis heyeri]QGM46411.1 hypothetical protein H2LOC_012290 [Methylocystis heyeri]